MERGAVYVELRARMEQFERDLDDAINRTKQKTDTASKAFSSSLTGVGQTMTKTLTPAAVAFGAFALQAFRQADAGLDTLRVKSGLTGDALADLQDSFKDVAGSVTSSLSEIGTVMGELQQRTGLTGDALEELTIQVLNLNEIGNQGSVETITRVFGDWSIATDDQTDALDALFRASQATGPSVDALGQLIVRYGAPLRQMGFGFEQSAALLGKFEKEGVNTELVMGSLRIALGKLARAGVEDVPAAFREMVTEI